MNTRGRQAKPAPTWEGILRELLESLRDEFSLVLFGAIAGLVRAMGVKVESGWTGLCFTFGRAGKELGPGFHILIPFIQRARKMPTRSRTLDLPFQRVVNLDGLVYHVDANLVYRITDVRKAMIQIDHLEKGMLQMLGLGVQEVLRKTSDAELSQHEHIDRALAGNLAKRLAPWGVEVERVGFPSISPSPQTLRITQLGATISERGLTRDLLIELGAHRRRALSLVGTRHMPVVKCHVLRNRDIASRRRRHLQALAKRAGWTGVELKQAEASLRAHMSVQGRSRSRSRA